MASILGGRSPRAFLRDHWQKRPLLVRGALPGFAGLLDRDALLQLATRPDAVSRLIVDRGARAGRRRWERHDGPFGGLDAAMLSGRAWTLLVHGVESLVPGGWELLRAFAFLPAARIDDLMVSYAAPGGSVGPHVDDYDVFLLQGPGRRRWQVSAQRDRSLEPGAAIDVLRRFRPEEEWVLEPGDMLYLPPGVAHHGVAVDPCFTYSVGFLAPSHAELAEAFLTYLAGTLGQELAPTARYADPDLAPARDRIAVGDAMVAQVAAALDGIRWDRARVAQFLGCFLTRPRAHARFLPPRRPPSRAAFARRLRGRGALRLALPTRGLTRRGVVYLNGAAHRVDAATARLLRQLFDERTLRLPVAAPPAAAALLHAWCCAGYLG